MIKFKQENDMSSISPSGFTGFIIKNSNVIVDNSFIKKGTSFINAFDNSNVLLKDCGSLPPIEVSNNVQYEKLRYKLTNEVNKKLLPFWYHYSLIRNRESNYLNYCPSGTVRLQPVAPSGNNINRLMDASDEYLYVNDVRDQMLSNAVVSHNDNNDKDENYILLSSLIEKRLIEKNYDSRNIEYTAYGAYLLGNLNSSIKAVFPLDKQKLISVDSPNILLNLKNRAFLPILKNDDDITSKIYLLSGESTEYKMIKYDKFGLPIESIKDAVLQIDTTDHYDIGGLAEPIHKYISKSKNSNPIYATNDDGSYKNFTLNYNTKQSIYSDSEVDAPYIPLDFIENASDKSKSKYYLTGPYTIYNVAYKIVNNDGTTSLKYENNPLTLYIKPSDTEDSISLYDLLNKDNLGYLENETLSDFYVNYMSDVIKKSKDDKRIEFDIMSETTDKYQPQGYTETCIFAGFYDSSYRSNFENKINQETSQGRLFNKNGDDITTDMIDIFLSNTSGSVNSFSKLIEYQIESRLLSSLHNLADGTSYYIFYQDQSILREKLNSNLISSEILNETTSIKVSASKVNPINNSVKPISISLNDQIINDPLTNGGQNIIVSGININDKVNFSNSENIEIISPYLSGIQFNNDLTKIIFKNDDLKNLIYFNKQNYQYYAISNLTLSGNLSALINDDHVFNNINFNDKQLLSTDTNNFNYMFKIENEDIIDIITNENNDLNQFTIKKSFNELLSEYFKNTSISALNLNSIGNINYQIFDLSSVSIIGTQYDLTSAEFQLDSLSGYKLLLNQNIATSSYMESDDFKNYSYIKVNLSRTENGDFELYNPSSNLSLINISNFISFIGNQNDAITGSGELIIDSDKILTPSDSDYNSDNLLSTFTLKNFIYGTSGTSIDFNFISGDQNNTYLYDYTGRRILGLTEDESLNENGYRFCDITFIKNENGNWYSDSLNMTKINKTNDEYLNSIEKSFLKVYLDKDCKSPLELVKNEESDLYEIIEYSGEEKLLISSNISNGYATSFDYEKLKAFEWEYYAENYKLEYAKDWYNINAYVNSNLFTDLTKDNYLLGLYQVEGNLDNEPVISEVETDNLPQYFNQKGHFIDDIYVDGIRQHDSGKGNREIVIADTDIVSPEESIASIFRESDSQDNISNDNSDNTAGKFEMNYKMFSFNFKIPERGWQALNDIMYEKNPYYGKDILNDKIYPSSVINTHFNSIDKLRNMAYASAIKFYGKLSIYYSVLKDGNFNYKGGFSNYNTVLVEIPWEARFNKNLTLLFVGSKDNESLSFIAEFESSTISVSKKAIINGLHFNCVINGIDYSIQMPAFEVRVRRTFNGKNISGIEIFARNRYNRDLLFNKTCSAQNIINNGYVYLGESSKYTQNSKNSMSGLLNSFDLSNLTVGTTFVHSRQFVDTYYYTDVNKPKTISPDLFLGKTEVSEAGYKPFAYSFWEDDKNDGGVWESFGSLYYYQNMAPTLEKNPCGYFKQWIPLAAINFVNESCELTAVNKIKNLHIGYKSYSHKDKQYCKYFTIEFDNPLSSEYVGIKGFDKSRIIIRNDRYATDPTDCIDGGIVKVMDGLSGYGAHNNIKFYTDQLNKLYYIRAFYLDKQEGMIYEDPQDISITDPIEGDKSCIASGLFLPPAITNVSITFDLYQMPKGKTNWDTDAQKFVPSNSFNLNTLSENKQFLNDYNFGIKLTVKFTVPTNVKNKVQNIGIMQFGDHGGYALINAYDENGIYIFNDPKGGQRNLANIWYSHSELEAADFTYNKGGWGRTSVMCSSKRYGWGDKSAEWGKNPSVFQWSTWANGVFTYATSPLDEDLSHGEKKTGTVSYKFNPLDCVNKMVYLNIIPIIKNHYPRYITVQMNEKDKSGNYVRKPKCNPDYIVYNYNNGNIPTYNFTGKVKIANKEYNCMFIGLFAIIKKSDVSDSEYKSSFKFGQEIQFLDPIRDSGQSWITTTIYSVHTDYDDYIIGQNGLSYEVYYDEHLKTHSRIINRGTGNQTTSRALVANKWALLANTINCMSVNEVTLGGKTMPNGAALPKVGEYLHLNSSTYDTSLAKADEWYCENTLVLQKEVIDKYTFDKKASKWNKQGNIRSADYANLNKEIRWKVAGYNLFKPQLSKPHMVLISDRPIILPVSAYWTYDGFFPGQAHYSDSGLSKYLNAEFLNAFSDSEFKEYLTPVSLDTAECYFGNINYGGSWSIDSMNNKTVKMFIPSRRNVYGSSIMIGADCGGGTPCKLSTGEVGLEDANINPGKSSFGPIIKGKKIEYTCFQSAKTKTTKSDKKTINGDPLFPIFNVPVSGNVTYTGTGGYGFMNKNYFMSSDVKGKNPSAGHQKGFILRGTNGLKGTYFVDFDGNIRCTANITKSSTASQARSYYSTTRTAVNLKTFCWNHGKKYQGKESQTLEEYFITMCYTPCLEGWPGDKNNKTNNNMSDKRFKGIQYGYYFYAAYRYRMYHNRSWIANNFNGEGAVKSLTNLKKLYKMFGPIYESAGGTYNTHIHQDPYRNCASLFYLKSLAASVNSKMKLFNNARNAKKEKNYSNVNSMFNEIDRILCRVWNEPPFNYNNDACKNNTMPIGTRIGILPVCIISPK